MKRQIIRDHTKSQKDELTIKKGDQVTIIDELPKSHGHWLLAVNTTTGEKGYIPDVCLNDRVSIQELEEMMARNMKPPLPEKLNKETLTPQKPFEENKDVLGEEKRPTTKSYSAEDEMPDIEIHEYLMQKSWYLGPMDRSFAERVLNETDISMGTFIARYSAKVSHYVISVKKDKFVSHIIIRKSQEGKIYIHPSEQFDSMEDMVIFYRKYPSNRERFGLVFPFGMDEFKKSKEPSPSVPDSMPPHPTPSVPGLHDITSPVASSSNMTSSTPVAPIYTPTPLALTSIHQSTASILPTNASYNLSISSTSSQYAAKLTPEEGPATSSYNIKGTTKLYEEPLNEYATILEYENADNIKRRKKSWTSTLWRGLFKRKSSKSKKIIKESEECEDDPIVTDNWVINYNDLILLKYLGRGYYGEVKLMTIRCSQQQVAVKAFKDHVDLKSIKKEIEAMKKLRHPNLVELRGICEYGTSVSLVMEYFPNKSLDEFLKTEIGKNMKFGGLLCIATGVVEGMAYLEEVKFIHRDLAARNVLISDDFIPKITDMGLARPISKQEAQGSDDFYKSSSDLPIPVRWTAPEALQLNPKWTVKCDVWSFGVLEWELFTKCERPPYADELGKVKKKELLTFLQSGQRLKAPENCVHFMYAQMMWCWNIDPDDRPTFAQLKEWFNN